MALTKLKRGQRHFGQYKQGQTIYQAALVVGDEGEWVAVLVTFYLFSHKTPLPKAHEPITRMNESYVNWQDQAWGDDLKPKITTSRRVAERRLKVLKKAVLDGVYD